jgi:hypothetical protein
MMITTASELGIAKMNKTNKLKICKAVTYLESYYLGYEAPVDAPSTLLKWYYKFLHTKSHTTGMKIVNIFDLAYDRPNYVADFETEFPGLLHKLYHSATKEVGHDAPISGIIQHMNIEVRCTFYDCPICGSLQLNTYHF